MAFASIQEFAQRFDQRTLGQLCEDLGTEIDPPALYTDPNIQVCLDDAAGDIVAACITNQHYQTQDLINLAASGTLSANLLKRINCVLALAHLFGRRIYNGDETDSRIPSFKWANDYLEMLKNGQRVFELPAGNPQSGVMSTVALGGNISPQGLVGHNRFCYGTTAVNINDAPNAPAGSR